MSWSNGTRLFSDLITTLKHHIPDDELRKEIYQDMLEAFEDQDWDTSYECVDMDPAFDEVYSCKYPDEFTIEFYEEDDEDDDDEDS